MRQQNCQINRPEPFRIAEMSHRPNGEVVSQVTRQEKNRGHERRYHAIAVCNFILSANKNEAGGQENRAQAVERGVDGGQIVDAHRSRSSWRTVATMRGRTLVHSMPSPPVSKLLRNRACLSTTTKIVVWMNKSAGFFWSSGFTGTALSLRLPLAKAAISALVPVKNIQRLKF